MKKNRTFLIAAITAAFSLPTSAEGLLEIYQLAKQNDSSVKAAEQLFRAEEEAVNISRGALYPQLSFSGSSSHTTYLEAEYEAYEGATSTTNSVSLDLSYPIYSSALGYAVDVVESSYDNAQVDYENAIEDLTYTTLEAYFDLLTQQSNLNIATTKIKATESQLQRVKKQFNVGQVAITDVHNFQAQYDANSVEVLTAESSVIDAQEALQRLTGKLITNIPDLAQNYPISMENQKTADEYVELASLNNKTIQALRFDYERADANISLQKASGRSPTLALSGSIASSDTETDPADSDDGTYTTSTLTLSLSLPLYEGGAINASVRQAVANAEAAKEMLANQIKVTEQSIRKQYRALQTTVAQIAAQKQLITSYTSVLKATEAGYNAGTRDVVDLLDAQSDLFDSQGTLAQLRYQFVLQRLALLEGVGALNEEAITDLDKWLTL